jgi:hypothetical protein
VEARLVASQQEVWRDRKDIETRDDGRLEIRRALGDCHDVIVLLTRETAASEQVVGEIETATAFGKRVHCFATFDLREAPAVYRHIQHLIIEQLPVPVVLSESELPRVADEMVDRLLRPSKRSHPLDLRDFEHRACRGVFPLFADICSGGRLERSLVERYSELASGLAADPARRTAALALNAGILAIHLGQWLAAREFLDRSLSLEMSAVGLYFKALATMRGVPPRHLGGAATDECVAAALQSWERAKSPLIALGLVAVLWDSGRGRSDNLAKLCADALGVLPAIEAGSGEIDRFLALMPFERGWDLPFPTQEIVDLLAKACLRELADP